MTQGQIWLHWRGNWGQKIWGSCYHREKLHCSETPPSPSAGAQQYTPTVQCHRDAVRHTHAHTHARTNTHTHTITSLCDRPPIPHTHACTHNHFTVWPKPPPPRPTHTLSSTIYFRSQGLNNPPSTKLSAREDIKYHRLNKLKYFYSTRTKHFRQDNSE